MQIRHMITYFRVEGLQRQIVIAQQVLFACVLSNKTLLSVRSGSRLALQQRPSDEQRLRIPKTSQLLLLHLP